LFSLLNIAVGAQERSEKMSCYAQCINSGSHRWKRVNVTEKL